MKRIVFVVVFNVFFQIISTIGFATQGTQTEVINFTKFSDPFTGVKLSFQLKPTQAVAQVKAAIGDKELPCTFVPFGNDPLDVNAVLILLDKSQGSSKKPRTEAMNDALSLISNLLDDTAKHRKLGVCVFDNELEELVPVGSAVPEIREKIKGLKANGMGTRINRSGMEAVKVIAKSKASRRSILLISDGKEEDTGFTRDDFVNAAKSEGIAVHTIGYPENEQDMPALGLLEKISKETGGQYFQAALPGKEVNGRRIPFEQIHEWISFLESGGQASANVTDVTEGGKVAFTITLKDKTELTTNYDVVAKEKRITASDKTSPKAETQNIDPGFKIGRIKGIWSRHKQGVGLVVMLLVGIIITGGFKLKAIRVSAKENENAVILRPGPASMNEPWAILLMQDGPSTKFSLKSMAIRIGRSKDNDIYFTNDSVSTHHAEIHQKSDGTTWITDLNSGNGVLVNGKRITQCQIKNNDMIELGEVRFKFVLT